MGVHRESLKRRRLALLAGTILAAALPFGAALAADAEVPVVKAPEPEPGWYVYGGYEAGVRILIDRPPDGFDKAPAPVFWKTSSMTDSRAKFEEYGAVPGGVFLDWFNFNGGTKDGKYAFDLWAKRVGNNDQSFSLDLAQLGQHYLFIGWDQTPHLISTSAKTVFSGAGTAFLTVDPFLRQTLQANLPNAAANNAAGALARRRIEDAINGAERPLTLATRRDQATIAYRWTPTADIDVSTEYTHEHRTGTRPVSVPYGWGTGASPRPTNPVEVPQPVDDNTQNLNSKAEYVGSTPWGTRWSTNVRYTGSFYQNDVKQLDFQNPFCITCNTLTGVSPLPPLVNNFGPNFLRLGLPPDSQANAITWNSAVDLPFFKSRYVTTFQYNDMRQNDPFINTGTNRLVMPAVTTNSGALVTSLGGHVGTMLWNNVYTAQPHKDVKFTARARHYDVQNDTPSLHINNWIFGDSGCAAGPPNPVTGVCPSTNPRNSNPISYVKDNANAEMSWRPLRWATVGAGWWWERWDRKLRDVNITNENAVRTFVDLTPQEYVHARGSYQYSERRYEVYDTEEFVEHNGIQFSEVATNMRRFDVANRNRHKAEGQLELTPGKYFTVSPNGGVRFDDYPGGAVFNPLGVQRDYSWNAGAELAVMVDPRVKLLFAYNYENRELITAGGSGANFNPGNNLVGCPTSAVINPAQIIGTACTWTSDIRQQHHTFMAATDMKVIPNTFDLRFEYVWVLSTEENLTAGCTAPNFVGATAVGTNCNGLQSIGATLVNPALVNFGQFPPERNRFQRFNVVGKYYVDDSFVKQMGWTGQVVVKVRYTWERNQNTNWASDGTTPYIPSGDTNELTGGGRSLFLAAFNPNYTAQLVALALAVKW